MYDVNYKINVVIEYYKCGENMHHILHNFTASESSIRRWIKLYKNNKLVEERQIQRSVKITVEIKQFISQYVLINRIFNRYELIKEVKNKYLIKISKTTIYNILKEMKITKRKNRVRFISVKHKDILSQEINKLKTKIDEIDQNNIISIDETSIDTHIVPISIWGERGTRTVYKRFVNARKRFTVLLATNNKKIICYKIVKNSANSIIFIDFIKDILKKYPKSYLFMDNARIHHSKLFKQYIESTLSTVIYNIPYCPEYNPIEKAIFKLKHLLRQKNENDIETQLINNIQKCILDITEKELTNYYKNSFKFTNESY